MTPAPERVPADPLLGCRPTEVRAAFDQAIDAFIGSLAILDRAALDRPATDRWRVVELVAHVCASVGRTRHDLVAEPGDRTAEIADTVAYYRLALSVAGIHDDVARRAGPAVELLGPDPLQGAARQLLDVKAAVAEQPDDAVLELRLGRMHLLPYLPSRVLELVVHGADLRLATGQPVLLPELPLRLTLDVITHLLEPDGATDALLALTGRRALPVGFDALG